MPLPPRSHPLPVGLLLPTQVLLWPRRGIVLLPPWRGKAGMGGGEGTLPSWRRKSAFEFPIRPPDSDREYYLCSTTTSFMPLPRLAMMVCLWRGNRGMLITLRCYRDLTPCPSSGHSAMGGGERSIPA